MFTPYQKYARIYLNLYYVAAFVKVRKRIFELFSRHYLENGGLSMCDICNIIEKSLRGKNPFFVKELETGIVVLGWNQHFYGYSIFMCKQHASELYHLDKDFCAKFMEETVTVSKAVASSFDCDKMNYECLGNGDTHLHWHLFPRIKGDLGDFGNDGKGPVWWLPQEIMWNKDNIPNEKELKKMKERLLKALNNE